MYTDDVTVHGDKRDHPLYSPTQHCTNEDCYTFSHTAGYCDKPQPRFCGCAFDYADGIADRVNEEDDSADVRDVRTSPYFSASQHCTNEDDGCYTFSHTAGYCGNVQPRFCGCAFDYADGLADRLNQMVEDGQMP